MSIQTPLATTYGARLSAYLTTYEDLKKHRKRLNKALVKLRHNLDIVTKDTRKYSEKEQTKRLSAADYDQNKLNGLLLLLLAERDSLYAAEIKSLLEISGSRLTQYKKLMITRLKRSLQTNKKLLRITENEADQSVRTELYIYTALSQGLYLVNKKRWAEALQAFSVARCGLELIIHQSEEDSEGENFKKTLLEELLDTLVDPSLSLAVSQIEQHQSTSDLITIARKHCHDKHLPYLEPAVELIRSQDPLLVQEPMDEDLSRTVTWREHEAHVYNDEIATKIVRLNRIDWQLFEEANDYDSLLQKWTALVDLHEADLLKNRDEDDLEKTQDGAIVLTYLKYHVHFTKLKRDLLLIHQLESKVFASSAKKLQTHRDVIRLYDSIISTVELLKDLPGVYNDEDMYDSLENMQKFFTAKRSVVVAESYALVNMFPEALKVYSHLADTFEVTPDFYKTDSFPYDVTSIEQVKELSNTIQSSLSRAHVMAQFHREQSGASDYVMDNVYKFPIADKVNKITDAGEKGALRPMLSKAVLFDIAFNYISYSTRGDSSTKEAKASGDKKKSGFFGIFGR
uniref:Signal recognition particle subunit SRP68 n=1 Tax=Candidozyma auris TaxID=498019 RepID=A0A0L0NRW3_CANAR